MALLEFKCSLNEALGKKEFKLNFNGYEMASS
jgi:hypothetical protein